MKQIVLIGFLVVTLSTISFTQKDFHNLTGPYLGQKPPGNIPELFAPGLITTYFSQSYIVFLHDARFCVYSTTTEKGHETYYTFEKNGRWTRPQRAPFEELQGHPNYTTGPLGRKVYFHSGRPTFPNDTREDDNIWTIEWTGSRWAKPQVLPEPANSEYGEAYPSAAIDGTVFFFTWKRTGTRGYDIWLSRFKDGKYQEAERLPWPINTDFIEYDPYVAPDQTFLIFGSTRPGGFGKSDNYICFRKKNGSWTSPLNLGRPINSSSYDLCANGTPDGKYFFFTSGRKTGVNKGNLGKKTGTETGEDSDLYWVDFNFINEIKNTVFTKQNAAEIIKRKYRENGIQSAVHTLKTLYSEQKNNFYFPPYELLCLAKTLLAEERTGDADLFVSALAKVLPEELLIKEGYGSFCALNGFVSKGLKIFEELASQDSAFDLRASLSSLGYLLTLYPDKSEDALCLLRFSVEKFPEDWFSYYSLSRIHRKLGNLDMAIKYCQKALEIRPTVGDVSQLMQRLLEEKKQEQNRNQKKSFPILKGPYLGQKPPGNVPELFAAGIVSTGANELNICFSADGNEMFYSITGPTFQPKIILSSSVKNSIWIKPKELPFCDIERTDSYPFIRHDGKRLFFNSLRSYHLNAEPKGRRYQEIWFVDRSNGLWGDPQRIDFGEKYKGNRGFPSVAMNGNLYFFASFNGNKAAIYFSKYENGIYLTPEKLGESVNGGADAVNFHPYIAPDESYLLFDSRRKENNFGSNDIYISFHIDNGNWSKAKNLGSIINSPNYELRPFVTYDEKYLFFVSNRKIKTKLLKNQRLSDEGGDLINQPGNGLQDVYWIDAKFLKTLKSKGTEMKEK
jgi:tetratricopeptide (TPR) repeat protein